MTRIQNHLRTLSRWIAALKPRVGAQPYWTPSTNSTKLIHAVEFLFARNLQPEWWSDLTSRRFRILGRKPAVVCDYGSASQRVEVNPLRSLPQLLA